MLMTFFADILYNPNHVIQPFYRNILFQLILLRSGTHNKILIDKTGDINKCSFLICLLYKTLIHFSCTYRLLTLKFTSFIYFLLCTCKWFAAVKPPIK